MRNGINFLDQPVNNDKRIHDNIRKITNDQGDDNAIVSLLHDAYFKENYKIMAIDLSKF